MPAACTAQRGLTQALGRKTRLGSTARLKGDSFPSCALDQLFGRRWSQFAAVPFRLGAACTSLFLATGPAARVIRHLAFGLARSDWLAFGRRRRSLPCSCCPQRPVVPCGPTIRSSRTRFAGRLNSGVRPQKIGHTHDKSASPSFLSACPTWPDSPGYHPYRGKVAISSELGSLVHNLVVDSSAHRRIAVLSTQSNCMDFKQASR